ncbi:MAG: glutamine amidotransferase [Desulfobacteraceae bacterium]|nr:MAG: glutamine amidotransferase [Desulfobacteraceae bacterium]
MKKNVVHLFVFNGLSDWETGYAAAGINSAQLQKNPGKFQVLTVAIDKTPVSTMGGLCIQPDLAVEEVSPPDSSMLILPGGLAWDEGKYTELMDTARIFLDSGKPVAAICGATAALAKSGLLDNRRHTSNARDYLIATGYQGAHLYEDAPAVTGNRVITASGVAPVDFAYHIFKNLDLYAPSVLEAWYGLFKTGRPEFYNELMQAAN